MFILLNTLKYLLVTQENQNFCYELVNMEDLPEYSPYIQSEILYRRIISNLKEDSKLSFLYLQLNSGAGEDLITSKTYYKIKMIPLVSIKNHMLNDFFPYFFIFDPLRYDALALNNPQTHVKSYNEYCLKRVNENVALHESNSNTVKILFLKFHEYSHSKYSSNYNASVSPQFVFKKNLSLLNNKKTISQKILKKDLKYRFKNYLNANYDENEYFIPIFRRYRR